MTTDHDDAAGKPVTISAREFVEQGYAEKIAKGECEVLEVDYNEDGGVDYGSSILNIEPMNTLNTQYRVKCHAYDFINLEPDRKFGVHWLTPPHPEGQPPATATDSGADKLTPEFLESLAYELSRYGATTESRRILIQAMLDEERKEAQAELTAFRAQLQAAEDTVRGLRLLCGRAAGAIDIEEYDSPENIALVDDLRRAAGEEG